MTVRGFRAGLKSPVVREIARSTARQVGREGARRLGWSLVAGVVAFAVTSQAFGQSLLIAVLVFVVVTALAAFYALVGGIAQLEAKRDEARDVSNVLTRKIGTHLAIHEWVQAAKNSIGDPSRDAVSGDMVGQQLMFLEHNVLNSIEANWFYPKHFADEIRQLFAALPGESSLDRAERVIQKLRDNLASGQYLRPS